MQKTLAEIAKIVDGEVIGDDNVVVSGLSSIADATDGDLTFVANSKYISYIKDTKAAAIITSRDLEVSGIPLIRTDNPSIAFAKIFSVFSEESSFRFEGIHKTAVIADGVNLGKDISIGPYAVIEAGVTLGDNCVVYGGCYIGHNTIIGRNCVFYPNVSIRERISIGDNVIVHNGTVIGSDGFGFEKVNGVHEKVPQIGTVVIEDNVEIGANVTIDRARFDKTFIGKGTKIDNLVQIAHNVIIEENCLIVAQVGISGSCVIEKNSILAGQAGLAGHLTIGEGSIVASQAGVTKSIPPNSFVSDYPAKPHNQAKRINACVNKLPDYVKTIRDLRRRVEELEAKNDKE